jgi:hypothetical protein
LVLQQTVIGRLIMQRMLQKVNVNAPVKIDYDKLAQNCRSNLLFI